MYETSSGSRHQTQVNEITHLIDCFAVVLFFKLSCGPVIRCPAVRPTGRPGFRDWGGPDRPSLPARYLAGVGAAVARTVAVGAGTVRAVVVCAVALGRAILGAGWR